MEFYSCSSPDDSENGFPWQDMAVQLESLRNFRKLENIGDIGITAAVHSLFASKAMLSYLFHNIHSVPTMCQILPRCCDSVVKQSKVHRNISILERQLHPP